MIIIKKFEDMHPISLLFYFLSVILPAMFFMNIGFAIAALLSGYVYNCLIERKIRFEFIGGSFVVIIFMTVINALTVHEGNTELFFINDRAVTLEALKNGLTSGIMLCAVFIWFADFNKFMTEEKILFLFRKTPKLGLLFMMILKFVPDYLDKYKAVAELQKNDGKKQMLMNLSAVFSWALENSLQTADSIEMRMKGNRPGNVCIYRFSLHDVLLMCLAFISAGIYFIPVKLQMPAFAILCFIPEIHAKKELIKWNHFMKREN